MFKGKTPIINILLPDYEEHAIRPYALGKFRDLVMATVRHPAMLVYLDNAQNAAGKINENYVRELNRVAYAGSKRRLFATGCTGIVAYPDWRRCELVRQLSQAQ